jgi:hypothetical protein
MIIVKTFVNVTMYVQYNNLKEKNCYIFREYHSRHKGKSWDLVQDDHQWRTIIDNKNVLDYGLGMWIK